MIYFTSDLHNNVCHAGLKKYTKIAKPDDLLIILGDVGLNFPENENYKDFAEYFLSLKCNIAFLDGNHENQSYLSSLPVEKWNGGNVHRITDNIVHLMRGNIFCIDGKSFFVMGGCKSSQKWWDRGLAGNDDEPSVDEIATGYKRLKEHNNSVDYVLTHKYSDMRECCDTANPLDGMLRYIDDKVSFKNWFCGHWHINKTVDDKHRIVYDELVKL